MTDYPNFQYTVQTAGTTILTPIDLTPDLTDAPTEPTANNTPPPPPQPPTPPVDDSSPNALLTARLRDPAYTTEQALMRTISWNNPPATPTPDPEFSDIIATMIAAATHTATDDRFNRPRRSLPDIRSLDHSEAADAWHPEAEEPEPTQHDPDDPNGPYYECACTTCEYRTNLAHDDSDWDFPHWWCRCGSCTDERLAQYHELHEDHAVTGCSCWVCDDRRAMEDIHEEQGHEPVPSCWCDTCTTRRTSQTTLTTEEVTTT